MSGFLGSIPYLDLLPSMGVTQQLLDSVWLAQYPRPKDIGFDGGSEFKAEFIDLCENMGLKKRPSGSWNPQSNPNLKREHQVLKDCLSTFNLEMEELRENYPFK